MRTALAEMSHQQPPTPVGTDNTAGKSRVNRREKQKKSQAIDMIFYWVRDRIPKNHFHIFWKEEKKSGRLCHKTPPDMEP